MSHSLLQWLHGRLLAVTVYLALFAQCTSQYKIKLLTYQHCTLSKRIAFLHPYSLQTQSGVSANQKVLTSQNIHNPSLRKDCALVILDIKFR